MDEDRMIEENREKLFAKVQMDMENDLKSRGMSDSLAKEHSESACELVVRPLWNRIYNELLESGSPKLEAAGQADLQIAGSHRALLQDFLSCLGKPAENEGEIPHSIPSRTVNLMKILEKIFGKKSRKAVGLNKEAIVRKQGETGLSSYVNSCFDFNFKEEKEERHFYEMGDLNEIFYKDLNTLINIPEKGIVSVEKSIKKYPNFDVVYCWLSECYRKGELNDPKKAREICLEGLQICRRKSLLCNSLAKREFESNNLPEAVKWWIRSCAVQSVGGQYVAEFPFLNLAIIAKYLGQNECYSILFDKSRKIRNIKFTADGEKEIALMVFEQGNDSVKQAIRLLCKNYYGTSPDLG